MGMELGRTARGACMSERERLEEQGVVIHADAREVRIRVQRQTTCAGCTARSGCGSGALAAWFGRRPLEIRLPNTAGLQAGDAVVLSMADQALVQVALLGYGLPLLGLLGLPLLWQGWFPASPEGLLILAGALGLGIGWRLAGWMSTHWRERHLHLVVGSSRESRGGCS